MIAGIGKEAEIFFCACLTGCTALLAYAVLRKAREIVRHSVLAAGLEDLVFWIGVSIYVFRQMYHTTYGSIRWYFIAGMLAGAGAAQGGLCFASQMCTKLKKMLEKLKKNR